MDKNTITGFVLIAILLIGFSWYSQPSEEELAQQRLQDSIAHVAKKKAEEQQQTAQQAAKANEAAQLANDSTAPFHNAIKGVEQKVVLKNDKVELTFNTKGGTVEKAVVKGFKSLKGEDHITLNRA